MIDNLKQKVKDMESFLINIRRYLHQNPELSGKEYKTANFINSQLKKAGIFSEIITTEAGPAVIACISNDEAKETIALRADIDALPLTEKENSPYCSKVNGVMHACGHDFNMVSVIGTGLVLASFTDKLNVNIKLIFQPSEESAEGGAHALVKAGVMDNINAIFTVHAQPYIEAGKIGIKSGVITAAIDVFKLKINGSGGHSARPHQAVDAIFIATQILNNLYASISRTFDPLIPIVISIGKIQGGLAPNIISDHCEIEGTVRTFDENLRKKIKETILERAESIAKIYKATVDVEWFSGPPPVINDKNLYNLTEKSAATVIGQENIVIIEEPSMGAEDFSQYLQNTPGMLIRVGTGGENSCHPLHSCNFNINESAISVSVNLLASIILNYKVLTENSIKPIKQE